MHELSYAQDMIKIIDDKLKVEHFDYVKSIRVDIGKYSGIEASCLQFCFDSCAKGTIVEGAKLEIDIIPFKIFCRKCKKEFLPDRFIYHCPDCQGTEIDDLAGQEILLRELEVE